MTDIIFLSNAKTAALYYMTQRAVSSCFYSTLKPKNIIVIEQQNGEPYELCKTVFSDEPFNYNKFANDGAKMGTGENIVICNNDLEFTDGWLEELLKTGHPLVSSKCPNDRRQKDIVTNTVGEQNGRHFSGWCFLIKRELWEKIGGFDEDFHFWCADDSLIEQVKKVGVLPMLVPGSKVKHLGSQTLKTVEDKEPLTRMQVKLFNQKYDKNLFNWGS